MGVGSHWGETECYRWPSVIPTGEGLLPLYVCYG